MQSPVIAMQNEVLRDLPMLHIPEPEPLPWHTPPRSAAPAASHAPTQVHVEAPPKAPAKPPAPPTAHVSPPQARPQERRTFEPEWVDSPERRVNEPRATERHAARAPVAERPKPVPAAYVPLEYTGPVDEAESPATEDAPAAPPDRPAGPSSRQPAPDAAGCGGGAGRRHPSRPHLDPLGLSRPRRGAG